MKRVLVSVPLVCLLAVAALGAWTGIAFPASTPQITDTDPDSPANADTPRVKGNADPGSTVTLYQSSDCTGPVEDQGSAATFASPGLQATVADDSIATFTATATDGNGTSPCSSPFTYREDSTAPDTQITSGPAGATKDTTPTFGFSSSEAGSSFECRFDSNSFAPCSGPGTTHTPSSALPEGTHTFQVRATDQAQNADQTPASRTFTVDTTAPATPVITATIPASPANDSTPQVRGTSLGTTVRLYKGTCTGTPIATGPASRFDDPGFFTTVPDNSTTTFRASAVDAAGNVSACSAGKVYVEDSIAPAAPRITETDPPSPAKDSTPTIKGTAEAGTIVRLYKTAGCIGAPAAIGTATKFASPGFTVTVPDNSTTAFRATATDKAGNSSGCSVAKVYMNDSRPPPPPEVTDSNPDSPANHNSPRIRGTATGTIVKLYKGACTGTPIAQGTSTQFASPGFLTSVADNSATAFRAITTDGAGNVSQCSAPLNYIEDSTPPAAPQLGATDPPSPANDNTVVVKGTARGDVVNLYKGSSCTGAPIAQGTTAELASPGFTFTVADNTVTTFRATVTDLAGNVSNCSTARTYIEDSLPPATPQITSTDPNSPANDNSLLVKGTAGGKTVKLYKTNCTGTPVAQGTSTQFASPGFLAAVPDDSKTSFRATATDAAGNVSGCSAAKAYIEDSTPPPTPQLATTSPVSPANDNTVTLTGTSGGATLRIYAAAGCTGAPIAQGPTSQLANPGYTVTVADNTTTAFRATSTDLAGNISPCSPAITYVEDSAPPAAPQITDSDPDSPANDNAPRLKGSAEAGSHVRLYESSDCTGAIEAQGLAGAFASPGLQAAVADDLATTFTATATDAAGNTSPCSSPFNYREDSTPPDTQIDSGPTGLTADSTPTFTFSSNEAGSTFRCRFDSDPFAACSGPGASHTAQSTMADGIHTFEVRAIDQAQNADASPASATFTVDTQAPAAPQITDTDPKSPANDNSPMVKGTAEAGSTVTLYQSADCTGAVEAQGSAGAFGGAGLAASVPDDAVAAFTATATDAVGNTSSCSSTFNYREDSTPPDTQIDSGPTGVTADDTPTFTFSATEPGSTFECRFDSDPFGPCSGPGDSHTPSGSLPSGAHTFEVRATDQAQNTDASPALSAFIVL